MLKFCFLSILFFILGIITISVYVVLLFPMFYAHGKSMFSQHSESVFTPHSEQRYFLTFCRHILPPSTGILNWCRWMLKWHGGRNFCWLCGKVWGNLAITDTREGKVDSKVFENFLNGPLQGLNQWQMWKLCDPRKGVAVVHSSKMSEKINLSTWCKNPTDTHHLNSCHENVTAYIDASYNT